jgi:histidinol-phosphate phosphatase family protein
LKTLICIDRDGTLIYDTREHLFLGRDNEWKEKIRILPHVVEGLRIMNSVPDSVIYMTTNQPGVAISDYPLLTLEKAHEVCSFVIEMLQKLGVSINGYFLCPHANQDYVKSKPGVSFDLGLVHDCQCLKPALGMVFDALRAEYLTPDNTHLYVIGDRVTDVQTALSLGGVGILIPFENQPGEDEKAKELEPQTLTHAASTMLQAAQIIAGKNHSLEKGPTS